MRLAPAWASAGRTRAVVARSGSPAVTNGMNALRMTARRLWKNASIGFMIARRSARRAAKQGLSLLFESRHLFAVLVTAAGEAHDHDLLLAPPPGLAHGLDHGVGRLQCRQDAFQPGAGAEAVQGLGVVDV